MVRTRTDDFAPYVPEASDARARAAAIRPHGAAPTEPLGAAPELPP
jgi:hypothetical protein